MPAPSAEARARGLALGCSSHGVGVVPIATSDRRGSPVLFGSNELA